MAEETPFYVGYRRLPRRLLPFLAAVTALVLLADAGLALLLYGVQAARPSGDWGEEGEVAIEGTLVARPEPFVLVPATPEAPARAVLLVGEGKVGAPAGTAALDGRRVTVQGYPLRRDGLVVLQLSQDPRAADAPGPVAADAVPLGTRTLAGEIVDSNCFLGAMNPGEGKVHRDCASLCILGGIPPLFVTRDAAGRVTYRLLADAAGGPLGAAAAAHAGEYLTLTGSLSRRDGIEIFAVPREILE